MPNIPLPTREQQLWADLEITKAHAEPMMRSIACIDREFPVSGGVRKASRSDASSCGFTPLYSCSPRIS